MDNILLKELSWDECEYTKIPKEWHEKLKKMQSYEEQEAFFFKAIEDKKKDIKSEIENMEDSLVEFKAFGLRYKRELEKIYNEQQEQLVNMWEELNLGDSLYEKVKEMRSKIKPLIDDVNTVKDGLKGVDTYRIEQLIKVMREYEYLSSSQKELLVEMLKSENRIK